MATGMTTHPKCGKHWSGLLTAHCDGCCETFTGITAWELHRDGKHSTGRYCKPPGDCGLVDAGRGYSCWGFPGDDTKWWQGDD